MRIEKGNIVIRSATLDDAIQLNKWWNDGRVMEHAGFPYGLRQSLDETMGNIVRWNGDLNRLCIIEIDGKPVGELNFKIGDNRVAFPGWKICDFDYQNKGYGPKIINMLFEFIFTDKGINSKFPVEKIVWDTMIENKRAQHVYENKTGAKRIGVLKDIWIDQLGNRRSAVLYEIRREDYFRSAKKT